jgi:hypothetical protein
MRWLTIFLWGAAACGEENELGGRFDCTPAEMVRVGCSDNVGRPCMGRPTMAICDGHVDVDDCTQDTPSPDLIVYQPAGSCPDRIVPCPASGKVVVNIDQGGAGAFTCTWDHVVIP